ncbi:rod shape-determining protein MreC [Marinactinospora thermotolerans]|uniref:Cell shape-determining protein MreC n=1 Tax=Marinactinospora thermotolerans DSM 45154 TaxID=1122192 RepID=A0A1T4SQ17_9ACTN|nr:rod shape-determining protein MreC [Marinactinospora thermotolerans]SKA29971.1 rod shape-determining protein MreC [Marinactinospora thermotolerans DSM 45154]
MLRDNARSRLFLGLLVVVSVVLLVLDSRDEEDPVTDGARAAGRAVFLPVSAAVSSVTGPVSDAYAALVTAPGARERIEELEARNTELVHALRSRDVDASRAAELDRLFGLAGLGGYEVVPAQAVTRMTTQGYADNIVLDVGSRDGVRENMTVINGEGLVGRVTGVGERTSTVLLVTDGSSAVGARMEETKEIGVIRGGSRSLVHGAPLRFELLDGSATVEKGQRIVTLGSHDGTPFVPGVPIGTIHSVRDTPGALTRTADVTPAVDISRIDIVGVVVGQPETEPREPLAPSTPQEELAGQATVPPPTRREEGVPLPGETIPGRPGADGGGGHEDSTIETIEPAPPQGVLEEARPVPGESGRPDDTAEGEQT